VCVGRGGVIDRREERRTRLIIYIHTYTIYTCMCIYTYNRCVCVYIPVTRGEAVLLGCGCLSRSLRVDGVGALARCWRSLWRHVASGEMEMV